MVDVRLSKDFRLSEFIRSETAARLGLDNTPDPKHLENLRELARALQKSRDHFRKPHVITSGFRSLELNRAVKGSPTSAHLHGWAADFTVPGVPLSEVMEFFAWHKTAPQFDQLILYPGRIHLGLYRPSDGTQRRQLLQTGDGKRFEVWEGVA